LAPPLDLEFSSRARLRIFTKRCNVGGNSFTERKGIRKERRRSDGDTEERKEIRRGHRGEEGKRDDNRRG